MHWLESAQAEQKKSAVTVTVAAPAAAEEMRWRWRVVVSNKKTKCAVHDVKGYFFKKLVKSDISTLLVPELKGPLR